MDKAYIYWLRRGVSSNPKESRAYYPGYSLRKWCRFEYNHSAYKNGMKIAGKHVRY